MIKFLYYCAITVLLPISLVACGGGGSSSGGNDGPAETTGTFSLDVSDAAVDDAERVLVQFTGVTVNPANGSAIDMPLSGDSQSCQDLLDGTGPAPTAEGEDTIRCIDLLELQGTQSASLLDGVVLEAGNYTWLRLAVDAEKGIMDSIIVLNDGAVESLYVPSGSQSGLKLNTGFTILAGGSHDFLIDFDLRKSVNDPKGFPDYRLKPSLRLIDLSESGNIAGTVETTLLTADGCTGDVNTSDGFAVYIYEGATDIIVGEEGSDNPPLTSASVSYNDDNGLWDYTVGFVAPGMYTVAFTCQAADDSPDKGDDGIVFVGSADSPTEVIANQDSTVNFVPTGS